MSQARGQWLSNFGFIMATVGAAVGLGNLWRFPYLAGEGGGGSFLLIYFIFLIILGFPIMLAELVVGRAMGLNAMGSYRRINPYLAPIGLLGIISGVFILSFYGMVGGWIVRYTVASFSGLNAEAGPFFGRFISSTWEPLIYQFIFMAATGFIVARGIGQGIEKYNKYMMPLLFIMLVLVAIRSVTLPGALIGLKFFLVPDFSVITMKVIIDALGQVFFSLALGIGCMMTYGSYLAKNSNLERDALVIPALDTLVSLVAGLAILPAVYAFGLKSNEGPGLIFVTLPEIFNQMLAGRLVAIVFFIMLLFAALTSAVSLLEMPVSYAVDERKWSRKKAAWALTLLIFILGVPSSLSQGPVLGDIRYLDKNWFDWVSHITSNICLPAGGFILCIVVGWVWGVDKAAQEIRQGGKFRFALFHLWALTIKFIAPILLFIVLLTSSGLIKVKDNQTLNTPLFGSPETKEAPRE